MMLQASRGVNEVRNMFPHFKVVVVKNGRLGYPDQKHSPIAVSRNDQTISTLQEELLRITVSFFG